MPNQHPSLEKFAAWLRYERGLSERTAKAYQGDLSRFLENSGCQVGTLGTADLRGWISELGAEGRSAAYVSRVVSSFRQFFFYLQKIEGARVDNPAEELRKPKLPKRLPATLGTDEVQKVIATAFSSSRAPYRNRNWALMAWLYASGMRVSEVCDMDVSHLKYSEGLPRSLKVIGKGNKERRVHVSEAAGRALATWLSDRSHLISQAQGSSKSGAVWVSLRKGEIQRLKPRAVQRLCERIGNRAGLSVRLHPHLLRHTFATAAIRNGAQLHAVKDALGHTSLETTGIYLHADTKDLEQVADSLPNII